MLAGWLSVSFGKVDESVKARSVGWLTLGVEFPPWFCSSCGTESSPSTHRRVPKFDFGSASGASDSNKILSLGTYRTILQFSNLNHHFNI